MRGKFLFKFIDKYIGGLLIVVLYIFGKIINSFSFSKKNEIKNILIIKFSAVGDTILLIPAIRNIKNKYFNANIDSVCTSVNQDVIKNISYINNVYLFDIVLFLKNPFKFLKFILNLRNKRYDVVINFDQWVKISSIITFLSGAKTRIGFKIKNIINYILYTDYALHSSNIHEIENFLNLLVPLNILFPSKYLESIKFDGNFAFEQLNNDKFIIIHPGCGSHGKLREWGENNYISLIKLLRANMRSYRIVLTGSFGYEENLIDNILDKFDKINIIKLIGIPIASLFALVGKSNLVISGNTGIVHIASSLGIPTLVIHGPTNERTWGPWGNFQKIVYSNVSCRPCLYLGFEYGCFNRKCFNDIAPEIILDKIKSMIDNQ